MAITVCKICGKNIEIPIKNNRYYIKKYCCEKCKYKARHTRDGDKYNKIRRDATKQKRKGLKCVVCGKDISKNVLRNKSCSKKCAKIIRYNKQKIRKHWTEEKHITKAKIWKENNREKLMTISSNWEKRNKHKVREIKSLRRIYGTANLPVEIKCFNAYIRLGMRIVQQRSGFKKNKLSNVLDIINKIEGGETYEAYI